MKQQDYTIIFVIFLYIFVLRRLNFNISDSGDIVTLLLCFFLVFRSAFRIYSDKNKITYVGHPLLDEITEFKKEFKETNKIAFMPGSRKTEITNLMPIFRELIKKIPNKEYILIIPAKFDNDYIKKPFAFLRSVCDERTFSFYLVDLLKEYCFIE